jgi:hypothetical protein
MDLIISPPRVLLYYRFTLGFLSPLPIGKTQVLLKEGNSTNRVNQSAVFVVPVPSAGWQPHSCRPS